MEFWLYKSNSPSAVIEVAVSSLSSIVALATSASPVTTKSNKHPSSSPQSAICSSVKFNCSIKTGSYVSVDCLFLLVPAVRKLVSEAPICPIGFRKIIIS